MKSAIEKLIFLVTVAVMLLSCSSGGHYHDGEYQTEIMFTTVNFAVDGNEISVDNSLTGMSKLYCKQFPDRIEYKEDDGTTRILTALDNGDLKLSEAIILRKINKLQGSTGDVGSEKNTSVYNAALNLIKLKDGFVSSGDFKNKVDELYKIHMNEVLRDGSVIDSDEVFTADITNDDKDEVIKYYTLATNGGGCMYVGRGIIVYQNTKIGVVESVYEPSYAFEFTGIQNEQISVSKLDFKDDDVCYPTSPTAGILVFRNRQLYFEESDS